MFVLFGISLVKCPTKVYLRDDISRHTFESRFRGSLERYHCNQPCSACWYIVDITLSRHNLIFS